MLDRIHELSDAEKASLIALSNISVLTTFIFINCKCNPNDFAHAVFAGWSIHQNFMKMSLKAIKILSRI